VIILDTNVVSEPLKPKPDDGVMRWLAAQAPETLYLSAITTAELYAGVEKMPKGRKQDALRSALNEKVLPLFEHRILSFDHRAAHPFAQVITSANAAGNDIAFPDAAIAAIAVAHGFGLATRNVRDFRGIDLLMINPWET
jgi:toxin FitB